MLLLMLRDSQMMLRRFSDARAADDYCCCFSAILIIAADATRCLSALLRASYATRYMLIRRAMPCRYACRAMLIRLMLPRYATLMLPLRHFRRCRCRCCYAAADAVTLC